MMTKNETLMRWFFDYLVNFYFIYFLLDVEELSFCFQFLLIGNFDFLLSVMANNQTKCGIIYEKIAMRPGDDERMIMSGLREHLSEFHKNHVGHICFICKCFKNQKHYQKSTMERFAKIFNGKTLTIFAKRAILDIWQASENASVTHFMPVL